MSDKTKTVETILDEQNRIFYNGKSYESYNAKAMNGEIRDEDNPIFLFQQTSNTVLQMIIDGEIDPTALAKRELEGRR